MKLIIGLGNPEEKYQKTRHNSGIIFIDQIVQKRKLFSKGKKQFQSLVFEDQKNNLIFIRSGVSMNISGQLVQKLVNQYKVKTPNLWIAHDDLDIQLGEYKIQLAKGPKDHNGLLSIEEELGEKGFWRIRIGVENREPNNRISGEEYVLTDFKKEEMIIIQKVVNQIIHDQEF